jgi:hypothetical protein
MARIARIVAATLPHHITQRGNRRQKTFFQDEDYRLYRSLIADWRVSWADRYGVENPAQRQRAMRIKYGVPGTPPVFFLSSTIISLKFSDRIPYDQGGFKINVSVI